MGWLGRESHVVAQTALARLRVRPTTVSDDYGREGFFERSMLSFAGIKPIRESLYVAFANETKRVRWIEDLRSHGKEGD